MTIPDKQLISLTEKYQTPLYCYEAELIKKRYHELYSFIPYSKLRIYYAMKANYNLHILKLLEKEAARIDAVSPGDVYMALKAGFSTERILFTANKISDAEMHEVQSLGVLFNIGSLSRLEKYAKAYPGSEVCIRFNPDVVAGGHEFIKTGGEATKFGILLSNVEKVVAIANEHGLKIVGIHEHTGSGIPETVQMQKGMKNILGIITPARFPHLNFVDFGGGFKVVYHPDENQVDYETFGKEVVELFTDFCSKFGRELEMYFEPGKYLVAESGKLLVEVTTVKQNRSKLIAGVNSGFAQLIRPMFYSAYHHIRNLSNPDGKLMTYDIVGNICESGDCFASNRELPEIREGDILVIETAGAYCYSMGSVYNMRAMPSEVLVDGAVDTLIRKRLSSLELVEKIVGESE
ncbi:diaminopimelate decarboxylase [archaeon]|jgi:diaminopimelate decarboxylase|nr:diaminopimelate decarboxylase [archaeon]MBT6762621.1 diaminopimelate decarboxylase [archaeon]